MKTRLTEFTGKYYGAWKFLHLVCGLLQVSNGDFNLNGYVYSESK